jgi:hypothetical protein
MNIYHQPVKGKMVTVAFQNTSCACCPEIKGISADTKKQATQVMFDLGWRRSVKHGGWVCPECAKALHLHKPWGSRVREMKVHVGDLVRSTLHSVVRYGYVRWVNEEKQVADVQWFENRGEIIRNIVFGDVSPFKTFRVVHNYKHIKDRDARSLAHVVSLAGVSYLTKEAAQPHATT